MGVIDSLTKGFQHVHRRWWVLLIPILLDAFLWIGPHASVAQLVRSSVSAVDVKQLGLTSSEEETAQVQATIDEFVTDVVPHYNGFSALRIGALGLPSLATWGVSQGEMPAGYEAMWLIFLTATDLPDMLLSSYESMWVVLVLMLDMPELLTSVSQASFMDVAVWQFSSEGIWMLATLGLSCLGIVFGSVYIVSISRTVDDEGAFWPQVLRFCTRFALFWILRFVLLVAAGIPLTMIAVLLAAFSPGLASLYSTVIAGLLVWLSFYGIFFVAAMAVNHASIWRAIWNSFNIVLRNFWPTFALFGLINLIGGGLSILWQQLSTGSLLTLLGIVGNAYVGTGLVAASMVFYQDRYQHWQKVLSELLRRSQRLA